MRFRLLYRVMSRITPHLLNIALAFGRAYRFVSYDLVKKVYGVSFGPFQHVRSGTIKPID